MPTVNKKSTRANLWNWVITNVLTFYYFDLSPLFEFIISIAILCHFYLCTYVSIYIATLIPLIFGISTHIICIPTLILRAHIPISFLAFPPLFSAFPSFRSQISQF